MTRMASATGLAGDGPEPDRISRKKGGRGRRQKPTGTGLSVEPVRGKTRDDFLDGGGELLHLVFQILERRRIGHIVH